MRTSNVALCAVFAATALTACGGGGGSAPAAAPAPAPAAPAPVAAVQGAYSGALTGSTSSQFQLLALDNGDFWALYGVPSGTSFLVRGFIQGTAAQSNGSLSSNNLKDFGSVPPVAGVLAGSISATAVSGTFQAAGGNVGFNGAAITAANSTYDFNAAANLSNITGTWALGGLDGTTTNVTIANNGSFQGSNGGCAITGTITPRASGKNVFDVAVVSGAAPCIAPGSTSTGIAVTYLLSGSTTRELIVAGVNSDRSGGNAFFGTR